ncbi:MAG: ATP-binding protein [bacterium]
MNRLIILLFIAYCGSAVSFAQTIDLTKEDLYVRQGFDDSWLVQIPKDSSWLVIPASETGNRPVRVTDLNFSGLPKHRFFSPDRHPARVFTFVTQFVLSQQRLKQTKTLGLYLASIGVNWEIYVNGRLIKSEMHLSKTGTIKTHRAVRDEMIAIDPRILRAGENILAFKILGDPTYPSTGFYLGKPYEIDDYEKLLANRSENISLILLSLYCFVGLYHLLLFIGRPKERYNLFFGLFSVLLALYLYSKTQNVFENFAHTERIVRFEFAVLFALTPLFSAFIDSIILKDSTRFTKLYSGFCAFLILLTLPAPLPFTDDILRVWQVSALVAILYIFVAHIAFTLHRDAQRLMETPSGPVLMRTLKAHYHALVTTEAGHLFVGILVIVLSSIFDILNSMIWSIGFRLTQYGFFIFIVSIAVLLANRFLTVHNKMEELNANLEKKVAERTAELNDALETSNRISRELQEAKEKAEAADQAKSNFLTNMSHELRTPLNAIIGMTELTLETALDPTQRENLKTVQQSSHNLVTLVDDILDFSKIERGQIPLTHEPLCLHTLVKSAVASLQVQAESKGLSVVCKIDDAVPSTLIGDAILLRQVLLKLLDNAIKFTERGKVKVWVGTYQDKETMENGDMTGLHITVSDTGIGISKSQTERIFEKFNQVDNSMTRKFEGTGLGLSICKVFVEKMAGKIWVESEEGKGSTFHVRLMLGKSKDDLPSVYEQKQESQVIVVTEEECRVRQKDSKSIGPVTVVKPKEQKHPKPQYSLLLVEDNPDNQMLTKRILEKSGYLVDVADNGKIAVEAVQRTDYDLILMDIQMPVMDGFEATRTIRSLEHANQMNRVPIVAVTAHALVGYKEKCLQNGMDDYITKPLRKKILLETVEKWTSCKSPAHVT